MESNFNDKKVKELVMEILGGKTKLNEEVVWVFRFSMKIYCGQLVEEARLVQMEEIKARY